MYMNLSFKCRQINCICFPKGNRSSNTNSIFTKLLQVHQNALVMSLAAKVATENVSVSQKSNVATDLMIAGTVPMKKAARNRQVKFLVPSALDITTEYIIVQN